MKGYTFSHLLFMIFILLDLKRAYFCVVFIYFKKSIYMDASKQNILFVETHTHVWSESCSVVSDSLWPHGLYSPWNSPSQNTGVGSLSLLQGIFPTQGSNPGLLHCRWILYQLNHKRSPRILEWLAYPFSSRSFWSRNETGVPCIAGGFFTNWAIREAYV